MPTDRLALALVAAGLVSGAIVAVSARAPREGLRCLLDFLLAAGLLRLAGPHGPGDLGVAAVTIAVRQIAGRGLRAAVAARSRTAEPAEEARRHR